MEGRKKRGVAPAIHRKRRERPRSSQVGHKKIRSWLMREQLPYEGSPERKLIYPCGHVLTGLGVNSWCTQTVPLHTAAAIYYISLAWYTSLLVSLLRRIPTHTSLARQCHFCRCAHWRVLEVNLSTSRELRGPRRLLRFEH